MSEKILLINPPLNKNELYGKLKGVGLITAPIGLISIAAIFDKNNMDNEVLDCIALQYTVDDAIEFIREKRPDIIGIGCNTITYPRTVQLAKRIKELIPETNIIVGGSHASILPKEILSNECVDFVVLGEGDYTALELVKAIRESSDFSGIKGIGYKEGKKIIINERRELIRDLDELPMPAWHKLNLKKYRSSPGCYRKLPNSTIITSRGCPFQCIYCSSLIFGKTWRGKNAKKIVEEIEYLMKNHGIKDIQIFDDSFCVNRKRTEEFCNILIEKKLGIIWNCETRVDLVDYDLMKLMKEAGCYEIGFGVESGNTEVLKFIKKGITLEKVEQTFKAAKSLGMDLKAYFIIGLPGDTEESVRDTINFAKKIDADVVQFTQATPYPGTEFYTIAEKEGKIRTTDWSQYSVYSKTAYHPDALSPERCSQLMKQAYKEYYMRPKFWLRQFKKIRRLEDIRRYYLAFMTIARF